VPIQPVHAAFAVAYGTFKVHRTQQLPPHMKNVVCPPAQLSPAVLHARGIASIGAASIGGASGGSNASSGGALRTEQLPSTQCCDVGHSSEVAQGAPSRSAGL
jgi:hypothetical protein